MHLATVLAAVTVLVAADAAASKIDPLPKRPRYSTVAVLSKNVPQMPGLVELSANIVPDANAKCKTSVIIFDPQELESADHQRTIPFGITGTQGLKVCQTPKCPEGLTTGDWIYEFSNGVKVSLKKGVYKNSLTEGPLRFDFHPRGALITMAVESFCESRVPQLDNHTFYGENIDEDVVLYLWTSEDNPSLITIDDKDDIFKLVGSTRLWYCNQNGLSKEKLQFLAFFWILIPSECITVVCLIYAWRTNLIRFGDWRNLFCNIKWPVLQFRGPEEWKYILYTCWYLNLYLAMLVSLQAALLFGRGASSRFALDPVSISAFAFTSIVLNQTISKLYRVTLLIWWVVPVVIFIGSCFLIIASTVPGGGGLFVVLGESFNFFSIPIHLTWYVSIRLRIEKMTTNVDKYSRNSRVPVDMARVERDRALLNDYKTILNKVLKCGIGSTLSSLLIHFCIQIYEGRDYSTTMDQNSGVWTFWTSLYGVFKFGIIYLPHVYTPIVVHYHLHRYFKDSGIFVYGYVDVSQQEQNHHID